MTTSAARLALVLAFPALAVGRPARAQFAASGSAVLGVVEHRVVAGGRLEGTSGTVFGVGATVALGSHVEVTATAVSGTLTANTSVASDQGYAAAEFRAALLPEPWLALSAGVSLHGYDSPVARQRWGASRVGAELRFPFVAGRLGGIVRAELLPTVSVSALGEPQHAYAATSGLTWEGGRLVASLTYALERYDFEPVGGFQRHEQLSTLTARVGLRLGAHHPSSGH